MPQINEKSWIKNSMLISTLILLIFLSLNYQKMYKTMKMMKTKFYYFSIMK